MNNPERELTLETLREWLENEAAFCRRVRDTFDLDQRLQDANQMQEIVFYEVAQVIRDGQLPYRRQTDATQPDAAPDEQRR